MTKVSTSFLSWHYKQNWVNPDGRRRRLNSVRNVRVDQHGNADAFSPEPMLADHRPRIRF
jgi:hypothetical protein